MLRDISQGVWRQAGNERTKGVGATVSVRWPVQVA